MPSLSAAVLRDNRLFQGVDDATLDRLAKELQAELVNPGDLLMAEGDVARHMFVIINGELEVLTHGGGNNADVRVALLGPGDWVGEMAVLDVQPRSATVRVLAPTMVLRLGPDELRRLVQDHDVAQYARMMANIARGLGRRLRVADRLIAQTSASLAKEYVTESMRPPRPA
jgi:CRP/FNR family transcriptional regulator, cyclic AMP receptor protein